MYDAFEHEEPKNMGFCIDKIREFVKENKPDVCIVYNDMMIIHQVVTQLKLSKEQDNMSFKIVGYIDQVYLNQKKEFIEFVNANVDFAILFTEHWQKIIVDQGLTIPTAFLPHGFNKNTYYPVPKKIARHFHGIRPDDFVILNLNRNQPRKRWDTCLKAFAELVSRYPSEPIKLVIGTALTGAWNLIEIFERELKKRGCTLQDGIKHLVVIDRPQKMTDEDTNILYNVADIGWNTCDGEGFGLCNFEQAAIGIPQVVPKLGGFLDFFDDDCSALIDPKIAYYVDNTRDLVCGEALLCDYIDYVEAIEAYYLNKDKIVKHGLAARKKILEGYKWDAITDKLSEIIYTVAGRKPVPAPAPAPVVVSAEVEKIDIATVEKITSTKATTSTSTSTKSKLKSKKRKEILKLKKKLDRLINDDDSDDS
jgi:glycosyltransferase involved in cell wall biosynthesis